MLPGIVDVTGITGAQVVGSPTSWQTPNGPFNVEHVGADQRRRTSSSRSGGRRSTTGRSSTSTAMTGQHVIGGVTSWQTRNGPFLVEHRRRAHRPPAI